MTTGLRRCLLILLLGATSSLGGCVVYETPPPAYAYPPTYAYPPAYYSYGPAYYPAPAVGSLAFGFSFGGHGRHRW
jgi:hypothetical protein